MRGFLLYFLLASNLFSIRNINNNTDSLIRASNNFALNFVPLLKQETKKDENCFFSPYGIVEAFGMAYFGADGQTKQEIHNGFYFYADDKLLKNAFKNLRIALQQDTANVRFSTANKLWPDSAIELKKEYLSDMKLIFDVDLQKLNFRKTNEAKEIINHWVSEKTYNKIPNLLEDLSPATLLVITNACYFKADWAFPFDSSITREDIFFLEDGNNKKIKFMNKYDIKISYFKNSLFEAIRMPYKNGNYNFYIFLPLAGKKIDDLLKKENRPLIISSFTEFSNKILDISIPKFKFRSKYFLKEIFVKYKIKKMFTMTADFSKITSANIRADEVIHEAYIEVNESGSEAAAATAIIMIGKSQVQEERSVFKADRPFLFAITYKNLILFLGIFNGATE